MYRVNQKTQLFLNYDIFRLRITGIWEIHMAAGTSWVILVTFPMVHMLLRMPHRCVEFTKWSIEWLEELSNKLVNKSTKIKIFVEVSKFQLVFQFELQFFKKYHIFETSRNKLKKTFYFKKYSYHCFWNAFLAFNFAFNIALCPQNTKHLHLKLEI